MLHGHAEIRNFSLSDKKYFMSECSERVKNFSTREEKFRISKRPCNIIYLSPVLCLVPVSAPILDLSPQFQALRVSCGTWYTDLRYCLNDLHYFCYFISIKCNRLTISPTALLRNSPAFCFFSCNRPTDGDSKEKTSSNESLQRAYHPNNSHGDCYVEYRNCRVNK